MKQKIMGLDASTTTIGLAILEHEHFQDIQVTHTEYYKPPKTGHLFERLVSSKSFIEKQLKQFTPDEVIIEDILLSLPGKTTAKTISTLAIFNRTIGLSVFEITGKPPIFYLPIQIRHAIKLDGHLPSKEEVPLVLEKSLNFSFPWQMKLNKRTHLLEKRVESYDIADAIGCAYYHILVEKNKSTPSPTKNKKSKLQK